MFSVGIAGRNLLRPEHYGKFDVIYLLYIQKGASNIENEGLLCGTLPGATRKLSD